MNLLDGLSIRKFHGRIHAGDGTPYTATYWVGMRLPENRDADDFTMVEVTHRYMTRRALLTAISHGYAWKR